jgi:hypothetical protein
MQPRCVRCKGEIPAAAVWAFSHGHAACQCGHLPQVYTDRALYREALMGQRR